MVELGFKSSHVRFLNLSSWINRLFTHWLMTKMLVKLLADSKQTRHIPQPQGSSCLYSEM